MRRSLQGRYRRIQKLRARLSSPGEHRFPRCAIIGCGTATTGLAIALCRKHLLHRQRHGSPFCPSPSAAVLRPYLTAATSFIKAHRNDRFIGAALVGLRNVMVLAGPVVIATRLRGLKPNQRSRIALARLRDAGTNPERLLAITLAVHALIKHDPAKTHRIKEWRIVAIAKAAHRLASGDHRVWELRDDSGRIMQRTETHTYPRSSGRVLRYLGGAIEKECEWVIDQHLKEVVVKISREATPSATS